MTTPIVLIHVRQGFVVPLVNDPSIVVCMHDEDTEDNQTYIDMMAEFPAFNRLTKSKTFEVANEVTPTAVESLLESPAPVDWGKELSKIQDLREKAKQYIISVVPADGLFIGGFFVYEAGNGDVEIRHIEIRKSDNHITLNNEDITPIYSGDVSDSDWVQLALIVQETINGGTGKWKQQQHRTGPECASFPLAPRKRRKEESKMHFKIIYSYAYWQGNDWRD